jgi:hypothetical protein
VSAGDGSSGAGRRLTPEEERRGGELFAEGKSEREVAAELHVGRGTAHRLRERLAERAAAGSEPEETTTVTEHDEHQAAAPGPLEMTALQGPTAEEDAAELDRLTVLRGDLADEVVKHEGRAAASAQALAALEAERSELLAADRDAQPLRPRLRDAADDQRDELDKAGIARGRLAEVVRQILAVEARQADRAMRADLAAAITERDRILAGIGTRQRAAILAVKMAAEDMCAASAEDRAAQQRVEQLAAAVTANAAALGLAAPVVPLAVSTWLQVPAGVEAPLPFRQMMWSAQEGQAQRVALRLAENFGWLPPDPAVIEADRERWLAMRAQQPVTLPAPPSEVVMDPRYGASYGIDEHGRPLPAPDPERRRQAAEAPSAAGWLGGQPWPA